MPARLKMDWLALESRLRSILRDAFEDGGPANGGSDDYAAIALHRIDAAMAAHTLRGTCYPREDELDEPKRAARSAEWERLA